MSDSLSWAGQIPHLLNFFLHFPDASWTLQVLPSSLHDALKMTLQAARD